MLAILKTDPQPGVKISDIPVPQPQKGEVLVKVLYASICGTDVGIYDWIPWAADHMELPTVIGHEVVGEVVEINGEPMGLSVGDIVSSETHIFCGDCDACKRDQKHICENMQLFGIGRNGGFAEYATIPIRTTWKNDPRISLRAMSVQEPFGNAMHVVSKAHVKGKKVLIMGLGPTGLCAAMLAEHFGAQSVLAVDPHEYRRNLTQKITNVQVAESVSSGAQTGDLDVVLEMSGAAPAIQAGIEHLGPGGLMVAFGIPKQKVELDWGKYLINKELTITSVFGRHIWDTWKLTSEILTSGEINLENTITHEFRLDEFEEAMRVMKSGESGKIILNVANL